MGMTLNHQEKQIDTDTDDWKIFIKLSSIWGFHFLNISEERHSDVWAMRSDLLPVVKRSEVGFSEDVELFACFCHL